MKYKFIQDHKIPRIKYYKEVALTAPGIKRELKSKLIHSHPIQKVSSSGSLKLPENVLDLTPTPEQTLKQIQIPEQSLIPLETPADVYESGLNQVPNPSQDIKKYFKIKFVHDRGILRIKNLFNKTGRQSAASRVGIWKQFWKLFL